MRTKKILFPISVDSERFGTEDAIEALNNMNTDFDEIIFLVADGLQLYNKASKFNSGQPLNTILSNFKLKNNYYVERERWLHTLKHKVNKKISDKEWRIINILSISDGCLHTIYRNILVSFLALEDFRNDIIEFANNRKENQFPLHLDYYSNYDCYEEKQSANMWGCNVT